MNNFPKKRLLFLTALSIATLTCTTALFSSDALDADYAEETEKVTLIPPKFVGESVHLEFYFPILGKIALRSITGPNGKEGMEGSLIYPENPIVIGPLTIDNKGTLKLINGILSITSKAYLDLGTKKIEATVGLREVVFDSKQDGETADANKTKTRKRVIESCRFGLELTGDAKELEIIPGIPISFKSIDLLLTSLRAPSMQIKGFLGKAPVNLLTTLDLKTKSLSTQGSISQCKVIDFAPFLKDTIFEDFAFSGSIKVSTTGDAHAEGHLHGKTKKDRATVELFPGVSASFDDIVFDLKKNATTAIKIKTSFLGASFQYIGGYDFKTKTLTLSAEMKKLKLVDLLPFVKPTDLKDITFDAKASISSNKRVTFRGSLSDEGTKELYGLKLKKIEVGLDTGKSVGFVTGAMDIVGLPASAKFGLTWGKKAAIFASAGFDDEVEEWQPFMLLPKVDEKLEFLRTMTVYQPALRLSAGISKDDKGSTKKENPPRRKPRPKKTGDEIELDQDEDVLPIEYLQSAGTHLTLTVGGGIKAGKLLGDIVKGVGKATNLDKQILELATIKDIDIEGLFKIGIKKGGSLNVVGLLSLPKGFGISDLLPKKEIFEKHIPGGGGILYEVLDFARMDYGKIVVCLRDEKIDGVTYTTGITVDTNIAVGQNIQREIIKSLTFMKDFFDKKGDRGLGARLFLTFNPLTPKTLVLKIGVTTGDFTFSIPKISQPPIELGAFDFSNLALDFVVRGTSLGVDCGFDFIPHEDEKQEKITFTVGLKASDTAIAGEGAGAGMWLNPFGIGKLFRGGFSIGDLGLFISETYQNINNVPATYGASLLLGHLGLSGKTTLGKTNPLVLEAFLKIGGDLLDTAFEFRAKNIAKIADLLQGFSEQFNFTDRFTFEKPERLDLNKLVVGDIKEIFLKFAPFGSNIGNIRITSGIGGAFYGELFGAPVAAAMAITPTSISMHGYLPDIKIGPLVMTKAGQKGIDIQEMVKNYFSTGAPSQIGPEFEFVLGLDQLPKLKANGELRFDLPNNDVLFKTLTDIEISSERLSFETDSQVGPSWANMRARIKGTTLDIGDPMKLLRQIQPDKLALEMEFSNTLSKQLLKMIDEECKKLSQEIEKTYQQFIEQIDRATTDGEVSQQENRYKTAVTENRITDSIVEWIKWRYVAAKRDLEKVLDPTGNTREFMKKIGLNALVKNIARGISSELSTLLKDGKLTFDSIAKAVIINKIFWKGTAASLTKGVIPGIEIDVDIRGKNYRRNVGDLDFTTPDKLNWSLAKISANTAQLVGLFFSELLGIHLNIPACSPSVLIEFQNQREDLTVSVKDANNIETIVPWKGQKTHIQTDILCQKREDMLAADELANATGTYLVTVNGRTLARLTCTYGPMGKEGITVRVEEATGKDTFVERMTQVNWGQKAIQLAPEGIAPLNLKVEIIREGVQSKIKFYVQEIYEDCPAKAHIEGVNQIPGLKVVIADDRNKKITLHDTSKRAWMHIDGLCRHETQNVSKKYTILVQGKEIGYVDFILGPANNEFMQAVITRGAGAQSALSTLKSQIYKGLGKEIISMPLFIPGLQRLVLKVELIKESTQGVFQSKCKIYVQPLGECGAQAWIEVQNQAYGTTATVEDAYGKKTTIPDWGQKSFVTLDPICQSHQEINEPHVLYIDNQKAALITCSFGPAKNETVQAKIVRYDSTGNPDKEVQGKNYERIGLDLHKISNRALRLEIVPIKESTSGVFQTKFKWYIQPYCPAGDAVVEVQNQQATQGIEIVRLDTKQNHVVPHHGAWGERGFTTLDKICRGPSDVNEVTYQIKVNGAPFAHVKILYTNTGQFAAHIRDAGNTKVLRHSDKYQNLPLEPAKFQMNQNMGTYTVSVVAVREAGQDKFKIYLQHPSHQSWGGIA